MKASIEGWQPDLMNCTGLWVAAGRATATSLRTTILGSFTSAPSLHDGGTSNPITTCLPWSREKERRMTKKGTKTVQKNFSLQRHTKMDFVSALVAMPVDYGNMFSKRCWQKTPPISQAHQKNRGSCDFFDRIEGAKVRFPSAESGGCKKRRFRRHSQLRRGHLLLHAAQVGTQLIHGAQCLSVCLSHVSLSSAPRT